MTGNDHAKFIAVNIATGRGDPHNLASFAADRGNFTFLDYVHAHIRARPCVAPRNSIVTRRARTVLPQSPQNGVTRTIDIDDRHQLLDPLRPDELGLHALQRIGMCRALIATDFVLGLCQHHHPARAVHDVIVQILAHRLVERARLFVDRCRRILQIVGADDRGIPARVAATQPAFFDDRHIGDPEVLAKVIGSRQTMPASTDDDDVIFFLRFRARPSAFPSAVISERFTRNGKYGVTFHDCRIPLSDTGRPWHLTGPKPVLNDD